MTHEGKSCEEFDSKYLSRLGRSRLKSGKIVDVRTRFARTLVIMLGLLLLVPAAGLAQTSPVDGTTFISPKFGTAIAWSDNWEVDESNTSIQVRRDVLALISASGDEAVLIELQSQRSYRTGEEFITASMQTYSLLPGFEVIEDHTDETPPSLVFEFDVDDVDGKGAGHIQSQPIADATMVVIVLGIPEDLEQAKALSNDEITVNGVPLLEALPICGDETSASDATAESSTGDKTSSTSDKTSSGSSGSKTSTFGGSDATPVADCVEIIESGTSEPRPTPTPEPEQGRADTFNNRSWASDSFPGVEFSYDRTAWSVEQDLEPDENGGRESVLLYHNELPSYVIVEVYSGYNGRASACIDTALQEAGISPGADQSLTDADGNVIVGSERGRVWAAYAYQLELDSGTADVGAYVECRSLPGAAGVLVFTMVSIIDSFDESLASIEPMLRSIRLG